MKPSRDIADLLAIMAALRMPGSGCPWDLEQTFATIAPYTIEEAYEVADAINRGDRDDLCEELGDLLLQVVFHARMAEEEGAFDFGDVVGAITGKLLRRHPHVFGDSRENSAESVKISWERIKAEEKAERAARGRGGGSPDRTLGGVPVGLPALMRALKLQKKAATVGFDWGEVGPVLEKIAEETDEVADAIHQKRDSAVIAGEIGDLLFAVVNLARQVGVDPDGALQMSNRKFIRRFGAIEDALAQRGRRPEESSLDEMDALWNAVKATERR